MAQSAYRIIITPVTGYNFESHLFWDSEIQMQPVSTRPRPESPRPHVTRGRSSLSHGLARPWPRTGKVGLDSGLESSITDRNNVNYARKRILKIVFVE